MRLLIIAGLVAGLVGPGLIACSGAAAGELERRHADRWQHDNRALDRTLIVGTLIEATMDTSLSWRNKPGDMLTATVSADVRNAHRGVVIPAGCPVGIRIALSRPAADKSRAVASMLLDVTSVTVWGRVYPVQATVEVAVIAPETRILFVLPEGLTVERPREADPEEINTPPSWGHQGRHITFGPMFSKRVRSD